MLAKYINVEHLKSVLQKNTVDKRVVFLLIYIFFVFPHPLFHGLLAMLKKESS